jgi:hypothetical protein
MLLFASVHAEYNLCNPYLHLGQIVAELGRKFVVDAVPGASLWIPAWISAAHCDEASPS